MRLPLIAAELTAAGGLLAAVWLVAPGEMARGYALATIIAGVLPGLLLTGDVKLLNAGAAAPGSNLLRKALVASVLNLPVTGIGLLLMEGGRAPALLAAYTLLATLGASAQAFSSSWYYLQADKERLLRSKAMALAARLGFAGAAIFSGELMLALAGSTVGTLVEFALNRRALPWRADGPARRARELVSPLGAAYALSRLVSAAIKLGLAPYFGALIASFVMIEQLVGGANSLFEKYFARSSRWRGLLRLLKLLYLLAMLAAIPWLLNLRLEAGDRGVLPWLALIACAALLPMADMYAALQRRSEAFVAYGSAAVSCLIGLLLGIGWLTGRPVPAALLGYVLMPGLTFLFYGFSSLHARHDSEHQAPR